MVTQNTLTRTRKLKLHWFVAMSSLPLLGVVTAFGLSPQTDHLAANMKMVVAEVALPLELLNGGNATTSTTPTHFWHNNHIQRGDTIAEILHRMNVSDADAAQYLNSNQAAAPLRQLHAGKAVQAETNSDGHLLALRFLDNNGSQIVIEKSADGFNVSTLPANLEKRLFMRTGEISSTLFAATDQAGLPDVAANQMVEIFEGDIDFHRDLRKGDKFTVVYEMSYSNGEPVRAGRVVAAEFINQGEAFRVVHYQADNNHGDYYAPDGKSVRKAFLRSPLEFSRVSSGFSLSRLHPVLGTWRSHKGVDYAAATGTKVKVTADGVVSFVGKQGGYGNVVMVSHQNRYTTVYGHLSRFTSGLRRGQRIAQGDIIGYVGRTGLASGPHLHYEFKINGQQRDPLRVALPDAAPIARAQMDAFLEASSSLIARLDLLHGINLANLD